MPKIVNTALKAKDQAWTFEAKATGPEAKAKAIKFGLEAKAWPRGLHHWRFCGTCITFEISVISCFVMTGTEGWMDSSIA